MATMDTTSVVMWKSSVKYDYFFVRFFFNLYY